MATVLDEQLAEARMRRRLPSPEHQRLIRQRCGVSQQAVAEAVGVDRTTVTRWEQGIRTPRGADLRRYLELLDRLLTEAAGG